MADRKIRVSNEIYTQLQRLSDRYGRSMRELVEESIKAYLLGMTHIDKPIKSVTSKIIPLQYATRCAVCGRTINKGELAYWVKYTFGDGTTRSLVICLDCYYKDTALADWYLKKKKLEAVVRGLKKRADELANQVEVMQVRVRVADLINEVNKFWSDFRGAFYSDSEAMDRMGEFIDKVNALLDEVNKVESQINALLTTVKPKREVKLGRAYSSTYKVRNRW